MTATKPNAVTVEVVRNALETTVAEMSAVMLRTSHAPIFSEGKDYSCALYDRDGVPLAQAHDCPIHLANIQFSLQQALRDIDEGVDEGDIVIVNDPYLGGSHLPDITVFRPICIDGVIVLYAANRAHHVDVGGGAPGSFVANATEIFQEGLRLPPVKLYRRGEPSKDLFRVILKNVRNPDYLYGDLHAQIAALLHADERVRNDLVPRFGLDTILSCRDAILDYSEARMRDAIGRLGPGKFEASDHVDDDGIDDTPLEIKVTVEASDGHLTIDFEGSSPQAAGPVNSVFAVTAGAAYIGVLNSLDGDIPVNGGCYRPIEIRAPLGTVVNPREPAACTAGNTYTAIRIIDTVRRALVSAGAPNIGAGEGEHAQFLAGGTDPATGEPYVFYEMIVGGWGATPTKAGEHALYALNANCENTPAEVFETRFPWRIRQRSLRSNSGGTGLHRGGDGMFVEYELLRGKALASSASDRARFAPYGLAGGGPGKTATFTLIHQGHRRSLPSKFGNVEMVAGDLMEIATSGGGGYGTPVAET